MDPFSSILLNTLFQIIFFYNKIILKSAKKWWIGDVGDLLDLNLEIVPFEVSKPLPFFKTWSKIKKML